MERVLHHLKVYLYKKSVTDFEKSVERSTTFVIRLNNCNCRSKVRGTVNASLTLYSKQVRPIFPKSAPEHKDIAACCVFMWDRISFYIKHKVSYLNTVDTLSVDFKHLIQILHLMELFNTWFHTIE